jgi:hypothetical protein
MTQQGLIEFEITNFQGVRNWEEETRIPKVNLWDVKNSDFEGGKWQAAPGPTEFLSALAGGTETRGLFFYPYQNSGVNEDYLIQYYNGNFYSLDLDAASRSQITGDSFTADEDIDGVVYNNEIFFVSPNNGMGYINGTTWGNTFTGTPPPGSIIESNAEKLWVAGVAGFPSVIFYSRTATAASPDNIKDWVTGAGSALVGKGGRITALRTLKGDTLYVFKDDSIHYLSGFDLSGADPVPKFETFSKTPGAINYRCVIEVENDLWYLTPNLELRSLGTVAQYINDTRTSDISLSIRKFLRNLDPVQDDAVMGYHDRKIHVSLKEKGSAVNNIEFIYDLDQKSWGIHKFRSLGPYAASNNDLYSAEELSGQIYKLRATYSNAGSPFNWNGKTLMVDLGKPWLNKRLRYVRLEVARSINHPITVFVHKDSYNDPSPSSFTLEAPTTAETGTPTASSEDKWGGATFGKSVWGGAGIGVDVSNPILYKRVFNIDRDESASAFGLEFDASVNGGSVEIISLALGLIPLPEKNQWMDY